MKAWVGGLVACATLASVAAHADPTEQAILRRLAALEKHVAALEHENAALRDRLRRLKAGHHAPRVEHVAVARHRAAPVVEAAPVAAELPDPAASAFSGPYVAAFGGLSRGIANNVGGIAPSFGLNSTDLSPDEAGVAAGFNTTSGRLMLSLETAWHYDFAGERSNTNYNADAIVNSGDLLQHTNSHTLGPVSLPQTGTCQLFALGCPGYSGGPISSINLADLTTDRLTINERGGGELVGRIGVIYGKWMPYLRLGAGASLFTQQRVTTNSTLRCDQPNFTYSNYFYNYQSNYGFYNNRTLQSCGSTSTSSTSSTSSTTALLPYFVLGLGVEANFGRYFARAEANASEYVGTSNGLGINNAFARYDGRIGLGARF